MQAANNVLYCQRAALMQPTPQNCKMGFQKKYFPWSPILNLVWIALLPGIVDFSRAQTPHDVLGPSSRKTPIAVSEIMWKPAPRTDGRNLECLTIYNSNPWFEDIGSYQ